jgi:hypothetical protein
MASRPKPKPEPETPQVIALRDAGVQSEAILVALKDHDLRHLTHVTANNKGKPTLIIAKLFSGDWSAYDPNPKIFSDMGACPVCGGDLAECHGLHGLARRWADEILEGRTEPDQLTSGSTRRSGVDDSGETRD